MNHAEAIISLHAAALEGDIRKCMRIFEAGLMSRRLYNQILRDAKIENESKKEKQK